MRNQALVNHLLEKNRVTGSLPARRVSLPEQIERKGDWCKYTIEVQGNVIIFRCPKCGADGFVKARARSIKNRIGFFLGTTPQHEGTHVACPQNHEHQFNLAPNRWKIISLKK